MHKGIELWAHACNQESGAAFGTLFTTDLSQPLGEYNFHNSCEYKITYVQLKKDF